MFEIISKGPRISQYLYSGWGSDARHKKRQTITVDAGLNGDMEKAIVNSMIALIRKDVSGDQFIFESQKLGRSVVLSARLEDTAVLQAFCCASFSASNQSVIILYPYSSWVPVQPAPRRSSSRSSHQLGL